MALSTLLRLGRRRPRTSYGGHRGIRPDRLPSIWDGRPVPVTCGHSPLFFLPGAFTSLIDCGSMFVLID